MSSQELVPAGSHTLVINEPDTTRAIMLMDSHDLEQAMAELRGEVLATFVYRPKGAKPQLTYAGVKEAARLYRNVHFGATAVPLPDGTWMITSYAHNLADNTRVDYPMPYPAFDLTNQEQAIKFRANLSKSLRNALAAVLPVAYLQTMIERWQEQGNEGRVAQAPSSAPRNVTPARSSASATVVAPQAKPAAPQAPARTPEPEPEPAPADEGDAPWPRSAADWSRAQLRQRIQEMAGHELVAGKDWKALAHTHGQPDVASSAEMTQGWLLGLYQAMRAQEYAERIARVEASPEAAERVTHLVAEALSLRDRRQITAQQYGDLCQIGEARKAELGAPLLSSGGGQGRTMAQVAS